MGQAHMNRLVAEHKAKPHLTGKQAKRYQRLNAQPTPKLKPFRLPPHTYDAR